MWRDAVARWAASSSAASAALEGRVVPPGFVRSPEAQAYLDARRLPSMTDTTEDPLAFARGDMQGMSLDEYGDWLEEHDAELVWVRVETVVDLV